MDKILKFLGIKRNVKTNSLDLSQFELPQIGADCMFKFTPFDTSELNDIVIIKATSNLPYIKKGIYTTSYRNLMVIVKQPSVKNDLNFHYFPALIYRFDENNNNLYSVELSDLRNTYGRSNELKFY